MRKTLQELTLKSNFMFGAVMSDEANCKPLLEMILGFSIERIEISKEHSVIYHPEYRGVRLDVYAKDGNNTLYNVEMQAVKEEALEKRSRYYHSQLDMELLTSGEDYENLPQVFVIFICDFDPFGKRKYCYWFQNCCMEDGTLQLQDGQHTIFLSTKGENDSEVSQDLIQFLKYVGADLKKSQEKSSSSYVRQLQRAVDKVKKDREMEDRYMLFELMLRDKQREGYKKGLAEGLSQGIAESILTILKSKGPVSTELSEQILQEKDLSTLQNWLKLSAEVSGIEEFQEKLAQPGPESNVTV